MKKILIASMATLMMVNGALGMEEISKMTVTIPAKLIVGRVAVQIPEGKEGRTGDIMREEGWTLGAYFRTKIGDLVALHTGKNTFTYGIVIGKKEREVKEEEERAVLPVYLYEIQKDASSSITVAGHLFWVRK